MKLIALLVVLIAILTASCAPAAPSVPTNTSIPSTHTALPPTATSTPAPEAIADAKDLAAWVDEFSHAYGGTVTLNGLDVGAGQLVKTIQSTPELFIESRQINAVEYSFLVLNGVPLALRDETGSWQEATLARLSVLSEVTFEFSRSGMPDDHQQEYINVLEKVAGRGSYFTFPSEMDTCRIFNDFSIDDWNNILENWDEIKQDLDGGKVPNGFPYQWAGAYNLIDFVQAHVEAPQFRGQHLVELRLPSYCLLADSIVRTKEGLDLGDADMLRILEFVVRTRVIQFPEVSRWNVQDEMIAAHVEANTGGDSSKRFWNNVTGLDPAELTTLVAGWIKQDNPQAKTYVVEDVIFEDTYAGAQLNIVEFDAYIRALRAGGAQVDGIISENNFWVFAPPSMAYISRKIDEFQALGFEIGGSETMIITGDLMINDSRRLRTVEVENRDLAQAELYRALLTLYLSKGIRNFGLGGIDDYNAWTNDVDLFDANPLLFDDEFHTKPAYYAIVQVLYEDIQ